ncbi:MAG: hypothetical protein K8L91_02155 [Anaerolineae bacterium]|nr:hypothetical protein [Anaerolineae bacterium]
MNQQRKLFSLVMIVIAAIAALILANTAVTLAQGPGGNGNCHDSGPYGSNWTGNNGGMMGQGMMNGSGWNGQGGGHHGMMGNAGCSMMGYMGTMMGVWAPPTDLTPASGIPLDLERATKIAEAYLVTWQNPNLALGEVLQFDNNFYGTALETDTGRGAFEFLINPSTGNVYLEPGPNMMWNLRYGMMYGGVYGVGTGTTPNNDGVEMSITPERARELAQEYLTNYDPTLTISEEAETFYGYYTLEILQDDQITGMLSVNGYTGQVWLHAWHGNFIASTNEID